MVPIIKQSDADKIKLLINSHPLRERSEATETLLKEINRAEIVDDSKIKKNVVQLNSYFEVRDIASGKVFCFTVTIPSLANIAEKRISILSPLGVALIGFKKGAEVEWKLPGGLKKLKIEKVEQRSAVAAK